jgi:hypothetical protein
VRKRRAILQYLAEGLPLRELADCVQRGIGFAKRPMEPVEDDL